MKNITLSLLTLPLFIISSGVLACDDKPCEKAYLSSTSQYIENHGRQATTARSEREAHAKNRERRDYATVGHIQREKFFSSTNRK